MSSFSTAVLCAAAAVAPVAALAETPGQIDWERRVVKATAVGVPDLNAPSIAVARLSAERTATAAAQKKLLEAISAAPVQSGGTTGSLLQKDDALRAKLQARLRGARPVKTHYFSDGGISLELQLALDQLPPEIANILKAPPEATAKPGPPAAQGTSPAPDAGMK
jgi:hypothetical protein